MATAHTSEAKLLRFSSGGAHLAVPVAWVMPLVDRLLMRESPKSATMGRREASRRRMLWDLRSRCTTPISSWRYRRPATTPMTRRTRCNSVIAAKSAFRSWMREYRDPSSATSSSIQSLPGSFTTPRRGSTLGWLARACTDTSRSKWNVSAAPKSCFTATRVPFQRPTTTRPKEPLPSSSTLVASTPERSHAATRGGVGSAGSLWESGSVLSLFISSFCRWSSFIPRLNRAL
mmetsp:Transcript_34782/g.109823  ORF Transcript_34782/g.109823 Transcript_34782/m.109823 type:complete len:232 (-) Transcript_34782:674-1369(-)